MIEVSKVSQLDPCLIILYEKDWMKRVEEWEKKTGNKVTKYYIQKFPKGSILVSYRMKEENKGDKSKQD